MSSLPGFTKINKFSNLEFDKTFDESMQLLNGNSKRYTWLFDAIESQSTFSFMENNIQRQLGIYMIPPEKSEIDSTLIEKDIMYVTAPNGTTNISVKFTDIERSTMFGSYSEDIKGIPETALTISPEHGIAYGESNPEKLIMIGGEVGIDLQGEVQYMKDSSLYPPEPKRETIPLTYNENLECYVHSGKNNTPYAYYNYTPNNGLVLENIDNQLDSYALPRDALFTLTYINENDEEQLVTVPLIGILGKDSNHPLQGRIPVIPQSVQYIGYAWMNAGDIGVMEMYLTYVDSSRPKNLFCKENTTGTIKMNPYTFSMYQEMIDTDTKLINGSNVKVMVTNE